MTAPRTVIIGAGMAGLACARRLADAGETVEILDKGRGIGGRLATRRTADGWQFDHGAQYASPNGVDFKTVLEAARDAGAVDLWEDGSGEEHFVGVPGMSAMAKHLAKGLDIHQMEEVRTLSPVNDHWAVNTETAERTADRVVMTVPAPQAAKLLGPAHPLSARLGHVKMAPCLTLMAAFGDAAPVPFAQRRDASDDLSWIACNSDKPGRPGPGCWIAQAGVAWSEKHLELERDDIAALMLPMLCDRIGADPASALFAAAQRWRYAHVATPLGAPFLKDENGSLWLGGDWCLGPRVEAAWDSGTAIANDILGHS